MSAAASAWFFKNQTRFPTCPYMTTSLLALNSTGPAIEKFLMRSRKRACAALDPIATTKIEELIHELKEQVTIVIVTHNMQQAARVSDFTAFFYLGELIEFGDTGKLFTLPEKRQTEDYITGRFG